MRWKKGGRPLLHDENTQGLGTRMRTAAGKSDRTKRRRGRKAGTGTR